LQRGSSSHGHDGVGLQRGHAQRRWQARSSPTSSLVWRGRRSPTRPGLASPTTRAPHDTPRILGPLRLLPVTSAARHPTVRVGLGAGGQSSPAWSCPEPDLGHAAACSDCRPAVAVASSSSSTACPLFSYSCVAAAIPPRATPSAQFSGAGASHIRGEYSSQGRFRSYSPPTKHHQKRDHPTQSHLIPPTKHYLSLQDTTLVFFPNT